MKKKTITILLCIISGILLGFSFPPFKTWFLIYAGVPVLLHLILTSERLRQAYWRGWFALFIFNVIACYWVGGWQSNDIFLKLGGGATLVVHPILMSIPILLTYFAKRAANKNLALLLFPLFWVGYEYFDNIWQLAFPWLELGNSEAYNLDRIQYIQYIGVHGVTFLICIISVLLYYIINKIYSSEWKIFSTRTIIGLAVTIILLFFPNFYSHFYLANSEHLKSFFETKDSSKIIKTAIIQPNIDPFEKWKTSGTDETVNKYIFSLDTALKFNADLFVINETSVPYYFLEGYYIYNTNKFFNFSNQNNKYILMGIPHLQHYPDSNTAPKDSRISPGTRERFKEFNSAILIEPGKSQNEMQIHKKAKLVPFSENVPYKQYLPFLGKLIHWSVGIGSWDIGPGLLVFDMNNPNLKPKSKFETLICYESVFSDFAREGIKNGAEFIIIITNDGWFGNSSGPVQHQQYAVLRAIENRKWIVRCAQTGISCYIDPVGNIYDKVPINTEGIISKEIVANSEKTFYSEHGDIIGNAGFYISCVSIVIFSILYAYKRKYIKSAV